MAPINARIITGLLNAPRVVILTGAGVSAESGIPTFRGRQTGLWEQFDAVELATPYAFERDPPWSGAGMNGDVRRSSTHKPTPPTARGFTVLNQGRTIPFPSTDQQKKFRETVRQVLGLEQLQ